MSVQEEFDTFVVDLPWNALLADRPSPTLVSEAAARYHGDRTKDWYPKVDNVVRPLDILICQRSNLGWGSSTHRLWAAVVTGALIVLVVGAASIWVAVGLTPADAISALAFPLVAPARELIEIIKVNRESADTKRQTEFKVLGLWQHAMTRTSRVSTDDCRAVQDRVVAIRHTNAYVPDWLDGLHRSRTETVMQDSAQHLVEEAERHGMTLR